jgi:hypothetical protein
MIQRGTSLTVCDDLDRSVLRFHCGLSGKDIEKLTYEYYLNSLHHPDAHKSGIPRVISSEYSTLLTTSASI